MKYKVKALYDAVIVKPLEVNEQKHGNIIISQIGEDKFIKGEVISVGPGHRTVTGVLIENTLTPGTKVILPPTGFVKFEEGDATYYIGKETEIFGILEEIEDNE